MSNNWSRPSERNLFWDAGVSAYGVRPRMLRASGFSPGFYRGGSRRDRDDYGLTRGPGEIFSGTTLFRLALFPGIAPLLLMVPAIAPGGRTA